MNCPYCQEDNDKVIDSRSAEDGSAIRRRRECLACNERFTTYERPERASMLVVKKNGERIPFDRNKILSGVERACEKRPIPIAKLESLADRITRELVERGEREVSSSEIGELVMRELRGLDQIAYVRFASVYREFKDVNEFMDELRQVLEHRG